ncbi:hypothetical protein [Streptomyces yangpuensis]|uniref:hypothetical protein n=1 Tax=Streptomyces yangpuensis TaxID=1648182 RepID=UPI003648ACD4
MSKVPEGFHRVRAHVRRNPTQRSAKRMSGWTIAGLAAGVWLWGQVFGFGEAAPTPPPTQPQPTASAPAAR